MGNRQRSCTYNKTQANKGKPFEDFLLCVHNAYQKQGDAVVHKVPTEFIPLRDGTGRIVSVKVERKSCVDYLGRYGPIPVAVEAKHTGSDRIRWDRVEDHQAAYLDDFCKDPQAVGIVLVSFAACAGFSPSRGRRGGCGARRARQRRPDDGPSPSWPAVAGTAGTLRHAAAFQRMTFRRNGRSGLKVG